MKNYKLRTKVKTNALNEYSCITNQLTTNTKVLPKKNAHLNSPSTLLLSITKPSRNKTSVYIFIKSTKKVLINKLNRANKPIAKNLLTCKQITDTITHRTVYTFYFLNQLNRKYS